MTRQRKLLEVLNVRLDVPLARELRRIAGAWDKPDSEVARQLLHWGIEVQRQLEAQRLATPFWLEQAEHEQNLDPEPDTVLEITAKRRPMTDYERAALGIPAWGSGLPEEDEHEA